MLDEYITALASIPTLRLRPPIRQFESPVRISEDTLAPERSILLPELNERAPVCKFEAEYSNPSSVVPPEVVAKMISFESAEVVLN